MNWNFGFSTGSMFCHFSCITDNVISTTTEQIMNLIKCLRQFSFMSNNISWHPHLIACLFFSYKPCKANVSDLLLHRFKISHIWIGLWNSLFKHIQAIDTGSWFISMTQMWQVLRTQERKIYGSTFHPNASLPSSIMPGFKSVRHEKNCYPSIWKKKVTVLFLKES